MDYKESFKKYIPKCEQEEVDKKAILDFIVNNDDCLERSNLVAHITSSAIITNREMNKVLFAHHNIYNSWAWVGGHNDSDHDLLHVALKEAKEETGIVNVKPYNEEILGIDVVFVQNHIKNGKYVPDHLHLNAMFLLIGDEDDNLIVKEDENSGVRWFLISEVMSFVDEDRIKVIYQKAFDEIERLKNKKNLN